MDGVLVAAACLVALTAAACVSEDEGMSPELVRDSAFAGYTSPEAKQTACGSCHTSTQREWQQTRHASAWAGLQAGGHADSTCWKCHTVNGATNLGNDTVGFFSVSEASRQYYQDVQCESCHGPGAGHVSAPEESQPIASISADTGAADGCGTCHNGTHHPFVEQWRRSLHGTYIPAEAANASCAFCHEGKARLALWAPGTTYRERSVTPGYQPITCAVCHDPHSNANPGQLRRPLSADTATNLCAACHQRRPVPQLSSSSGPHAPQGPTLFGISGWRPAGYEFPTTPMRHGETERSCATCHVSRFTVNDAQGDFAYQSVGHSFLAIPCVNSAGMPDSTNSCGDASRNFSACASSECHGSESHARELRAGLEEDLLPLVRTLWIDGNGNGRLDAFPTDSGMVAVIRQTQPTQFSTSDTLVTTAEGSFFNAHLVGTSDGSMGVHNPFLEERLLTASIAEMRRVYALPVPPAIAARVAGLGVTRR